MDYLWTPWRYRYVTSADKAARQGIPAALDAWPGDRECVFCNMIEAVQYAEESGMAREEAERAAKIIQRAEHNFVCLNAFPYTSGHVMVVPYRHESSLAALDSSTAREMMDLAQQIEVAFNRVYSPQGVNLGMNLGKAAGAGIAGHLHLHALPRWVGDTNFMTVVGETRVLPEDLDLTWSRMREALSKEP